MKKARQVSFKILWIIAVIGASVALTLRCQKDPLSTMRASLDQLPILGEIVWTQKSLPFVSSGSGAGTSGVGLTALRGRVYFMGGFLPAGDGSTTSDSRTAKTFQVYDPATDSWQGLPDLPGRREYGRSLAASSSLFFAAGGSTNSSLGYQVFSDVFRADVTFDSSGTPDYSSLSWTNHSSLSIPRTHGAFGLVDSLLIYSGGNRYIASEGGYSERTIQTKTEVLDLTATSPSWRSVSPIPGKGRGWCGTAVAGDLLYLLGGATWNDRQIERLSETLSYNPKTDTWSSLKSAPVPASGWGAVLYKKRYIILVGGVTPEFWIDVALAYDIQSDSWFRLSGVLPTGGINDPGVALVGDTLYVAGAEAPNGAHYNTFLVGNLRLASP